MCLPWRIFSACSKDVVLQEVILKMLISTLIIVSLFSLFTDCLYSNYAGISPTSLSTGRRLILSIVWTVHRIREGWNLFWGFHIQWTTTTLERRRLGALSWFWKWRGSSRIWALSITSSLKRCMWSLLLELQSTSLDHRKSTASTGDVSVWDLNWSFHGSGNLSFWLATSRTGSQRLILQCQHSECVLYLERSCVLLPAG